LRLVRPTRHAKNACIFLTAAYLVHAIPQVISETVGLNTSYARKVEDVKVKEMELIARAQSELDLIDQVGVATPARPTMFTVASTLRGQ
jgi:hypothetical protein